jgi:hypothetical protein
MTEYGTTGLTQGSASVAGKQRLEIIIEFLYDTLCQRIAVHEIIAVCRSYEFPFGPELFVGFDQCEIERRVQIVVSPFLAFVEVVFEAMALGHQYHHEQCGGQEYEKFEYFLSVRPDIRYCRLQKNVYGFVSAFIHKNTYLLPPL